LSSPSPFRFYNANVETLLESNNMGGAGFSGISANFYPWLHARLCSSDVSEHDKAKIQRFLSVAEVCGMFFFFVHRFPSPHTMQVVVCDGYPKSAKA
jgi:dihydrodipicolinate synthase/N-acetylneuraminate lyase